ncbi:GIY-YIG nuclease family protein [Paraburkholderia atlantica]|uniref:GIY-YIG nuclease family protein n=1 Tax=Paraburkholderia atlantica TaxID=2654982 RepID=UPI0016089EC9|nr:GIY-YIG nuclease family protein [Paraburkholderia atlantica]MBB5414103.1 group I intron endonuclease [Paraburkholderia atlantica]
MFVYLVTGPSGKRYVGITSKTVAERWGQHVRSAARKESNSALHAAIRKYGEDAFSVEQIKSCETWDEACEMEKSSITAYGTFTPSGYNLTLGGEGFLGCDRSTARAKMSAWHSAISDDVRAERARKMSEANANRTPEERARISGAISASKRGKKRDPEMVAKVANANRGKTRSVEAIAKTVAGNTGRKHSDECRARMSEAAQARRERTAETMREIWRQRKAAQIGGAP